ncbi:MAG: DUF4203 domain-containing protein [Planctomycetota bacterium]
MKTLNVTEKAFGTTAPCPGCNQPIKVPHPTVISSSARPIERSAPRVIQDNRTARASPAHLPSGMPPIPSLPVGMPPVPDACSLSASPKVKAANKPGFVFNLGSERTRQLLLVRGAAGGLLLLCLLVLPILSGGIGGNGAKKVPQPAPVGEAADRGFQELRQATAQVHLPPAFVGIIAAISIVGGLVECFFGYRLFMVTLAIVGFLFGAVLAGAIGAAQSHEAVVALLSAILGGFIGAVLMIVLHFVGVFVLGAALGGIIGALLCAAANSNPEPVMLMIPAIVGGIVALLVRKFMIIVATAFTGAWSVVTGIAYFTAITIDRSNILEVFWPGGGYLFPRVLCWLALGIFGVIVQYKVVPLSPPEPNERR